jgi:uncharacterized protein YkwD
LGSAAAAADPAPVKWARNIALAAVAGAVLVGPPGASASGSTDPLLAPESACPGQSDASLPAATQERAMICLNRWARRQAHRSGLHVSKQLRASSARKARDIRHCDQFSHYACGRNAFYWEQRVGFFRGAWGAGENLALTYGEDTSPHGTMDLWLHSPEHRRVLLSPRFRDVGMTLMAGEFDGNAGAHIWVAQFGYHH